MMIYFFLFLLLLASALLAWVRLRDYRYLKSKTREALSLAVQAEIDSDKQEFNDLQKKFADTLSKKTQDKFRSSEIVPKP